MSTKFTSSARARTIDRIGPLVPRGAGWARALAVLRSSWTLGLIAAAVSWNLVFVAPFAGIDPSWIAGLYIAAHRGLHFGTQVLFTYGPLGYLGQPWLWYSGLGTVSFIYQAVIHILLCVSLVWALRRSLHPAVALVGVFLLLLPTAGLDAAVALTAVWCLAALSPEPPPFASRLVVIGGGLLGAAETLIYLRSGLVILAMCAITSLAGRSWRRDLPLFVGVAAASFAVLWFAAGQSVSNFPDFVTNSLQIISGYSDAMGVQGISVAYRIAEILVSVFILAAAGFTSLPGRARIAALLVMAVPTFALFKEANVRADAGHALVFFATVPALIAAIAFGRRWLILIAALVAVSLVTIHLESLTTSTPTYSPITHVRTASDEIQLLFDPSQRNVDAYFYSLIRMTEQYKLPQATLSLLKGRSVQVIPWEVGAAWAYGLDWDPGPVIQDYSAYTSGLDSLDAKGLRSPTGPQRILRQNPTVAVPASTSPKSTLDYRYIAWDPPEESLAMLCNYVPLQTIASWQVLGKVPSRCAKPQLIGSINTRYGATVSIPSAPAGEVVYAKIHGAEVSGLERVRSFLFRARFRYVVVNGASIYRLVPDTAADGLIMDSAVGSDYPAPFTLAPQARTIKLIGPSGSLRIDLYAMKVRPG